MLHSPADHQVAAALWLSEPAAGPSGGHRAGPVPDDVTLATGPRVTERRQQPEAKTVAEVLRQVPALVLLDRLPVPILGVESDGNVVYANDAYAKILGYPDATSVTGSNLCSLMAGDVERSPQSCVDALRDADGGIVEWRDALDCRISTVVSSPLLVRVGDPVLLVSVTDVTEWLWTIGPAGHGGSSDETTQPD